MLSGCWTLGLPPSAFYSSWHARGKVIEGGDELGIGCAVHILWIYLQKEAILPAYMRYAKRHSCKPSMHCSSLRPSNFRDTTGVVYSKHAEVSLLINSPISPTPTAR